MECLPVNGLQVQQTDTTLAYARVCTHLVNRLTPRSTQTTKEPSVKGTLEAQNAQIGRTRRLVLHAGR